MSPSLLSAHVAYANVPHGRNMDKTVQQATCDSLSVGFRLGGGRLGAAVTLLLLAAAGGAGGAPVGVAEAVCGGATGAG